MGAVEVHEEFGVVVAVVVIFGGEGLVEGLEDAGRFARGEGGEFVEGGGEDCDSWGEVWVEAFGLLHFGDEEAG